jgi:hypothetical protein
MDAVDAIHTRVSASRLAAQMILDGLETGIVEGECPYYKQMCQNGTSSGFFASTSLADVVVSHDS